MRIAVITFHNTSNFGATLQCVALSCYLKEMGHQVEVINYLPPYIRDKKSIIKELKKIKYADNKPKATVKGMAYLLHAREIGCKNRRFEKFIQKNLNLSHPYFTYSSLIDDPPAADLYLCGSDQIWNPSLTGGDFDEAFFLRFAKGKKASYGASLGELNIDDHRDRLAALTEDFSAISVRENSARKKLESALNRRVETVLDCTLLIGKEAYSVMESREHNRPEPYLLLYNIQNSAVSVALAKRISKEKGLRIIDISPNFFVKIPGAKNMKDIGPDVFLSLFHNASYVVTNSFHGTVFSIIYEKQFITIPHSKRASRMLDLLEILGLKDRIALESGYHEHSLIDYKEVNGKLQLAREKSLSYLRTVTANGIPFEELSKGSLKEHEKPLQKDRSIRNNIPNLVEQRVMCCGCAACMNICRQNAIVMREDEEGFLYPHIDPDLCIRCYLCLKVCVFKRDLQL
ncbi:MAG: polysaccharide pyruvyl transferase family protein [Oscillospiraceae bacterium]|nr:polysaccharide pyruvyl transferase family protein [Oscillospiraceae bacterium]